MDVAVDVEVGVDPDIVVDVDVKVTWTSGRGCRSNKSRIERKNRIK